MKFTFKIQKYQTQAVDALVKCFEGQQFADKVQYLRDKGIMPQVVKPTDVLFSDEMLKQVQHNRIFAKNNTDIAPSISDITPSISDIAPSR